MREWTDPRGATGRTRSASRCTTRGSDADFDRFAEMAKKVVAEQIAVFGEPADFDYGTYTFIADYLPWVAGDGMEHRNSTILTSTRPLAAPARCATWARSRTSSSTPGTWSGSARAPSSRSTSSAANMSRELWFAEGFTSYYDGLTIRRAGLISTTRLRRDALRRVNTVINSPAGASSARWR